ncbi:MAG: sensor histidine kinase [Eubacteriales bacterium]|nr:sensor histidine kinase [Eubacteriales bacterium]
MSKKRKTGIKGRAMRRIALLILVVMAAAVSIFSLIFRERLLNEQKSYSKEHVNSVMSYLNDYIDEVDSVAKSTNYNYYLQDYLEQALENESTEGESSVIAKMAEYEMGSRAFSDILLTRTDISSIMVFGRHSLLIYKTLYTYRNVLVDYSAQEWYQKAVNDPGNAAVTGPNRHIFFNVSNEPTLSLSRVIQNWQDGSFLGVVLIDMNLNEIRKICGSFQNQEGFLCILNEKGELVYEQEDGAALLDSAENLASLTAAAQEAEEGHFKIRLNGKKYLTTLGEMEKTGWQIFYLRAYGDVTAPLRTSILLVFFVVLLVMLLTLAVLNGILSGIIRPLNQLQEHMERVDLENLNQQVEIESEDEIGKLSRNFNRMLERIDNLKGQVVQEQENKRRYELQALQAQINPHFLYNTLDSIIWMAETNDKNIVPMTEALAKLFRISLNKGNEEIPLSREIEHVKNYLIIQTMRYEDKFTYEILVEPEVENCRIIKLILQPIVENSIYHGIKAKKGMGHIRIEAFREGRFLKLQVSDDGCGMSQEMCDKMLSDEIEPTDLNGSGIGVKNVDERIRLRFGREYGLRYYGELGKGVTVVYTLPFGGEEAEHE